MSATEKRLIREQRKLETLRDRIRSVSYLKTGEVRAHLQVSRATLYAVPIGVLPYTLTPGGERRYHPEDVAAYPARARAWARAKERGEEAAYLARMEAALAGRDAELLGGADAA